MTIKDSKGKIASKELSFFKRNKIITEMANTVTNSSNILGVRAINVAIVSW